MERLAKIKKLKEKFGKTRSTINNETTTSSRDFEKFRENIYAEDLEHPVLAQKDERNAPEIIILPEILPTKLLVSTGPPSTSTGFPSPTDSVQPSPI